MRKVSVASKYKFNYPKIQDAGNSLEIKPYEAELDRSRQDEMGFVMTSVSEIRSDLESLKTEVFKLDKSETDYLRKKMYDIEEKISRLKDAIKEELLNLLREEINLNRDVEYTERRLEEWGKPVNTKMFRPLKQSNGKVWRTNENPAVQFLKFLSSSGGRYGGWAEQDHLLFLRERKKLKGKEKFLTVVQCLLPDLSLEQIVEHEKWYQKYEDLKNFQKEAIQKWKSEKESLHKKEKEKTKVEGEGKGKGKEIKKTVHQQINITERIKEWKNQKLLRKLEEEERQKKEKERLKEEERRRAEMNEIKKVAVNKYKAEKLKRAQENFNKEERESLSRETKIRNGFLLKSFRLQDLEFIEKKKVIRFQIESKANAKAERWRLSKPALELILQRDPERIFQPTFIWNRHCLEAQKREKLNPVFDLNSIPRLAIPEWRKELK